MIQPLLNSSTLIFTFRPRAVNDNHLAPALQTAKMLATKLKSELVAASVGGEVRQEWSKDFLEDSGENVWTQFILRDETSNANAAADLVSSRSGKSAEAVIVVTHLPKSPVAKIFQHFTSNLLSVVKYPVIAINAKSPSLTDVRKSLFVTDLSKEEKVQFRRALRWAKKLDVELVIGNCLLSPWELDRSVAPIGISSVITIDDKMMKDSHEAHKIANVWINEARDVGVRASFEHVTGHLSVSTGMLEAAKDLGADFIIISRKNKSKIVATLLGSTLSEVLAGFSGPVMILPSLSEN